MYKGYFVPNSEKVLIHISKNIKISCHDVSGDACDSLACWKCIFSYVGREDGTLEEMITNLGREYKMKNMGL